MAEKLAFLKKKGGSGSGAIVVRGTAEKTATDSTKVTLGFKPTFVMFYNISNSNTIHSIVMWDSSRPNVQVYSYGNQVDVAMPYSNPNLLASIDNDGFTVNRSSSFAIAQSIEYIAIKE